MVGSRQNADFREIYIAMASRLKYCSEQVLFMIRIDLVCDIFPRFWRCTEPKVSEISQKRFVPPSFPNYSNNLSTEEPIQHTFWSASEFLRNWKERNLFLPTHGSRERKREMNSVRQECSWQYSWISKVFARRLSNYSSKWLSSSTSCMKGQFISSKDKLHKRTAWWFSGDLIFILVKCWLFFCVIYLKIRSFRTLSYT